jgi:hypothetical protein
MKYYAINGDTIAIADKVSTLTRYYKNVQKLPDDYYERCYIVQGGELVVDESAEKAKAIEELDATYNRDKTELANYYLEATIAGDADLQAELKAEIDQLNADYDEARKELEG